MPLATFVRRITGSLSFGAALCTGPAGYPPFGAAPGQLCTVQQLNTTKQSSLWIAGSLPSPYGLDLHSKAIFDSNYCGQYAMFATVFTNMNMKLINEPDVMWALLPGMP